MGEIISADVPDELAEQIDEAQGEGESRSATVRRLIRDGLEEQGSEDSETFQPRLINMIHTFLILSTFGLVWRTSIVMSGGALPDIFVGVNGWAVLGAAGLFAAAGYAVGYLIDPNLQARIARWKA